MIALRIFAKSVGIIGTLMLARLLTPADFGLVAIAMTIIALTTSFSEIGLDVALISMPDAGPGEYNTAWTIMVIRGIVISVTLLVSSSFIASFFDDARLTKVLYVLSISFFLQSLSNIAVIDFRKYFEFHKEFLFQIIPKILSLCLTISIALAYNSYWALIFGVVVTQISALVLSYCMHRFRPNFSLIAWQRFFDFSIWITLTNLLSVITERLDYILISKNGGMGTVGVFTIGKDLGALPTTELVWPISKVLLPGFSEIIKLSPKKLSRAYQTSHATLATLAFPVGFGIALTAELLVDVLLGPQWKSVTVVVQIVGIVGSISVIAAAANSVLYALGRTRQLFYLGLLGALVKIPAVIFGMTSYGFSGFLIAYLLSGTVYYIASIALVSHIINLSLITLTFALWRCVIASAVMAAIVYIIVINYGHIEEQFLAGPIKLLSISIVGIVVYWITLFAIWFLSGRPPGAEKIIASYVQSGVRSIYRSRRGGD